MNLKSNQIVFISSPKSHTFHNQLSCDTLCAQTLELDRGQGHFQLLVIYSRALRINILLSKINPTVGQVFVWDHHL